MGLTPFANVVQYKARYGPVSDENMLTECLLDCTVALIVALERAGVDWEGADELLSDRLMRACRQMARRVMPDEAGADVPVGATSITEAIGPYSHTYGLARPYSTPKVTGEELSLIGIFDGTGIGYGPLWGGD